MLALQPTSILFPYTTLFRSHTTIGAGGAMSIQSQLISQTTPGKRVHTMVEQRLNHIRSEEHTSELQSRGHLVCRLLLEKKKNLNPASDAALSQLWSVDLASS